MENSEIALLFYDKYRMCRSRSARMVIMEMARVRLEKAMYIDFLGLCLDHLNAISAKCEVCDL